MHGIRVKRDDIHCRLPSQRLNLTCRIACMSMSRPNDLIDARFYRRKCHHQERTPERLLEALKTLPVSFPYTTEENRVYNLHSKNTLNALWIESTTLSNLANLRNEAANRVSQHCANASCLTHTHGSFNGDFLVRDRRQCSHAQRPHQREFTRSVGFSSRNSP